MMKTGFLHAFANKPVKKIFYYHGMLDDCNKPPEPETFEEDPLGPPGIYYKRKYFYLYEPLSGYDQDGHNLVQGPSVLLREADAFYIMATANYWDYMGSYARFQGFFDPLPTGIGDDVSFIVVYGDNSIWGEIGDESGYLKIWFIYDTIGGTREDYCGMTQGTSVMKIYLVDPYTGLKWTKAQANNCWLRYEIHAASVYLLFPLDPYRASYSNCNNSYIGVVVE